MLSASKEQQALQEQIAEFVMQSKGLQAQFKNSSALQVTQALDNKSLLIEGHALEGVIKRLDGEQKPFLQVNFLSGKKVLLTSELIGFKPAPMPDLKMTNIPRVVTTPDAISVYEAIQDTIRRPEFDPIELRNLRRLFEAIVSGAEAVGIDLSEQKAWLSRLSSSPTKYDV